MEVKNTNATSGLMMIVKALKIMKPKKKTFPFGLI